MLTILFYSCNNEKVDRLSYAFSSYNISFDKKGADTIIYAIIDDWKIWTDMVIDGTTVAMPQCEEVFSFSNSGLPVYNPGICSSDILTVKYDFLQRHIEPVSIEGTWFKIIKNTLREINIVVHPNLTGKSREIRLSVDISGTSMVIYQSEN
jgi:hypothetical protein